MQLACATYVLMKICLLANTMHRVQRQQGSVLHLHLFTLLNGPGLCSSWLRGWFQGQPRRSPIIVQDCVTIWCAWEISDGLHSNPVVANIGISRQQHIIPATQACGLLLWPKHQVGVSAACHCSTTALQLNRAGLSSAEQVKWCAIECSTIVSVLSN